MMRRLGRAYSRGDVDEIFVDVEASGDQVDGEVEQAHHGHEQVEVVEVVKV